MGEAEERLGRIEEAIRLISVEKNAATTLGQWQLLPQTIFNGIMVILAAAGIIGLVQQSALVGSMQTEINAEIKVVDAQVTRDGRIEDVANKLAVDVAGLSQGLQGQSESSRSAFVEVRGEIEQLNKRLSDVENALRPLKQQGKESP
jgi:hypothetical protein